MPNKLEKQLLKTTVTVQKLKFFINYFFITSGQICRKPKKPLMKNFIFCKKKKVLTLPNCI